MSLLRVDTIRSKDGTGAPSFDLGANVIGDLDVDGTTYSLLITGANANFVGVVTAANFVCYSDKNLKINIEDLTDSLDKISQLNGIKFNWKETGSPSIGLIAQDVESVIPEIVSEIHNIKTINYIALIPFLIESIKELKKEIQELKNNK
jgi:hypothetical protein